MTKYSTAIPATLILSLFSSVVHGQSYNERNGKLLKTSNDFQCFSDGLHEDPNNCSVFYRCLDWGESSENSIQSRFTSMKFQCAEGTVFDIERSNCVNIDETSRLECRQLADDITFSRIFERQAGEPDYGVVQPSSEYNQPNQPPSYNRPGPEEPSEQTPGDSGYGDGSSNEPPSSPTSPPCEADGFFPIPNDCTHFYRCVSSGNGFLKYDFACGPGTVWDPDNNACNHPWATSRPDCRSSTDGNQGGSETIEISESPETAAQVAEPSSTTTAAPTTNRPTTSPTRTTTSSYGRPTSTTSSSYGRPSSTTSSSYGRPSSTTSSSYGRPSSTTSSSYGRPSSTTSSSYGTPSTTTTKRSTAGVSSSTTSTETPVSTLPVTEESKENGTNAANVCTAEGFFPDEKNCTKFYRCVDEGNGKYTKYEFECAEGTVWDVQETTCNYPYAVQVDNCNVSSSESQTSTTAGQSSTSTSSSSQASSRPPSSSTSSSYNRPTSSTSSNNHQSSSSQTTSSSSQTSSSSSSSSSQTTSSSSQTSSSQQTSSSSSSTSSQSTSSNQQTTSSQQSSSSSNQNNTTSSSSASTASSNNSSQTSKSDKCEVDGFFPSSENCNKFYRCVSNEAGGFTKYNFNCGPGTVWDPENNVCNHPWAVKDEKCRSGGQGTTPLSESTTESVTSSTQNGTSSLSTGTTESSKTTTTPSAETSSPSTSQPTESSSQPSTPPTTTTEDSSKPTEPSENSNTTTTTESTDGSTTPPYNSTETTTETGPKNSTKPNNNGIKCEKAGYYPNPKDCKKFYRCVDWDGDKGERFSVYHFDCPEGTIFDPSLNICNHEESVYPPRDCTGSGSQTTDSPSTSKPDNSTTTESPSTTDSSNTTDVTTTEISSEPTTLQTTTDASNNTTEPITTSPSETTPQATTPSESTTKKEPETTTNALTTTPSDTTTPSPASTTQPTTTEISTTPSSSETCPELGPDQYALVCPTGFRRHPKYCNLFYQCTVSKTMDTKIVILSCVNGTLYDEKKIQCLPPDETKKCEGSMMADARNLKKTDDSVAPITVKSDKSMCPNEGLFSYKDDCRLFYKCKKDDQGKLSGLLYQCPEGFAFWSISKRCEKTEKVPCENSKKSPTSWKSTLAPVESRNIGF